MKLHRTASAQASNIATVPAPGAEHERRPARRVRRALAAVALTSGIAAGGFGAVSNGSVSAHGCVVQSVRWGNITIRSGPGTNYAAIGTLPAGGTLHSQCYYITNGGPYTACSSAGTTNTNWIPLIGGGWVAWRCVSGPMAH